MRSSYLVLATVAAVSVVTPRLAGACEGHGAQAAGGCPHESASCEGDHVAKSAPSTIAKVTVADVASLLEKKAATAVDVNSSETRTKHGVIPGARLLSSASKYDPAKELPAEKAGKLVFYCAVEKCTASHQAAERAVEAGYTNVTVMPEGIKGWKAAGKATSAIPRS